MPDALTVAFWVLATIAVGSGLMVVWLRDLFRAALFLATLFLSIAGLYVLLQADFLAAAQVLIYVGAVSVLLIFAIFLTHNVQQGNPPSSLRLPALALAALVFFALVGVFLLTPSALVAAKAAIGRNSMPNVKWQMPKPGLFGIRHSTLDI